MIAVMTMTIITVNGMLIKKDVKKYNGNADDTTNTTSKVNNNNDNGNNIYKHNKQR